MLLSRASRSLPVLLLVLVGVLVLVPTASATPGMPLRTWVSGVGDDANPCSRTAPCKTFAGAISKTNEGGEINAIDPGPFGAVSITKPITIDGGGMKAGVLNSAITGITININPATWPNGDVTLRGIDIAGSGDVAPAPCFWRGLNGIRILRADTVLIHETTVRETSTTGIDVAPTAGAVRVLVDGSNVQSTCGTGINVAPALGASAAVLVRNSTVSKALGVGIRAADRADVRVTGSAVFDSVLALQRVGTGIIDVSSDTRFFANDDNGTPTSIFDAPPAPSPATPPATSDPAPAGASAPTPDPAATPAPVVAPPPKLIVVLSSASAIAPRGAVVKLPYAATGAGTAVLRVTKGGKVVATVTAKARLGKNVIAWNGKVHRSKAAAGTYLAKLTVSGGGQTASDAAKLVVR